MSAIMYNSWLPWADGGDCSDGETVISTGAPTVPPISSIPTCIIPTTSEPSYISWVNPTVAATYMILSVIINTEQIIKYIAMYVATMHVII